MRPADDIVPTPTVAGYDSPRIVDSDMGDSFLGSDLEFFNAALPHDSPSSPSHILDEDILGTPRPQGLPSDSSTIDPDTLINLGNKHPSGQLPPLPKVASASPPSSGQDSSSDSSRGHKRKSSTSSQDNAAMGDPMMTDDVDMSDWKNDELMMGPDGPNFTRHSGFFINQSSNPLEMDPDFETSNKVMENHFDFDSAASSPRHDVGEASIMSVSSNRPMNRVSLPSREAPRPPQHHNRRSQVSTVSEPPPNPRQRFLGRSPRLTRSICTALDGAFFGEWFLHPGFARGLALDEHDPQSRVIAFRLLPEPHPVTDHRN